MEITCKRCQTEYDFDDALVSERGTTVRCTNCGEQFKVFRRSVSAIPERWVVQRRDGRELVFTSLRDLQRAITNLQVGRHDTLTRGSGPPRPLGSIAELEPFFLGRIGRSPSPAPQTFAQPIAKTAAGLAPSDDIQPRTGRTGRPPPGSSPVPPPAIVHGRTATVPLPAGGSTVTSPYGPVVANPPAPPLPPPQPETLLGPAYDPPIIDSSRISYSPEQDWFGEPHFSHSPPGRSRALRGLVALFVLGMLGVAGATVGRKFLVEAVRPGPTPAASDARVEALLEDGDRALFDGDLETARESFDKASALAEHDVRVLVGLARLGAARADVDWLRVRLLGKEAADVLDAAKRQAQLSSERALKLANSAAEIAPDDPKVARVKIDALRVSNDLASARMLVPRASAIANQPETAYVLAALDLAEDAPNWAAVIDRLKTAAAGEQNLLRARAALAYALARSGDSALAKLELEKIAASPRPYPIVAELKAFIARGSTDAAGKHDAGAALAGADARAPKERAPEAPREPQPAEPIAGDFRLLLQQASQALAARQLDRADQLYRAALAKDPGDTEALSGLGDVSRARGDTAAARSYYEQVLARNPHYLPALSALADIRWNSGDRAGAAKLYRDIVESVSDGALAQRARDRLAQLETNSAQKPTKPEPVESPPPATTPPSEGVPPGVDTSDLPGFKR